MSIIYGEDQDGAAWGLHPRRVRRRLAVNMQKGVQEDGPSAGAFAYPSTFYSIGEAKGSSVRWRSSLWFKSRIFFLSLIKARNTTINQQLRFYPWAYSCKIKSGKKSNSDNKTSL